MAAHPQSAAKKAPGFYEEVKENFGEDRRSKRPSKKTGEAIVRQSEELFEIEVRDATNIIDNKLDWGILLHQSVSSGLIKWNYAYC